MIVVKLQGGLGNQMFQYAAARSLALRLGSKVYFDTSWFDNIPSTDTKRWYELGCFDIDKNTIDIADYQIIGLGLGRKTKLRYILSNFNSRRLWSFEVPDHKYHEKFKKLKGSIYLDGWFTSEKYFINHRDALLKDFTFTHELNKKSTSIIDKIKDSNSVSLHVRRGDYITNKNARSWHGTTGVDYYKKAIEIIEKKVENPQYFVFSDDIEWCKTNLARLRNVNFIDFNNKGSDDMRLMIECQHNIIANSTFSWWGAWLNDSRSKVVVAPMKWLSDPKIDTTDVLPERWIKI